MASAPPTRAEWLQLLKQAQDAGNKATKLELSGSYNDAFATYIDAAKQYLYLIRHCSDDATRVKLKDVSGKLLQRAERIKAAKGKQLKPSTQIDRTRRDEQDAVLHRSSTIAGRWLPIRAASASRADLPLVSEMPLSEVQAATFAGWRRSEQPLYSHDVDAAISQGTISDCSVVTSLIVIAEHLRRYGDMTLLSGLHPEVEGRPVISEDGIYDVQLQLNGARRWIRIDDRVPTDAQDRCICVRAQQRWPMLLEKAYLATRGGYAFQGSDPSVDLYALTTWIPERLELRTPSFRAEDAWRRLKTAFSEGHCLITVGTGSQQSADLSALGLTAAHAYAVIDLYQSGEVRHVRVRNPWTTQWTRDMRESLPDVPPDSTDLDLSWEAICMHFAFLYANWSPAAFTHQSEVSFEMKLDSRRPNQLNSTTFELAAPKADRETGDVCLLLSRHLADQDISEVFIGLAACDNAVAAESISLRAAHHHLIHVPLRLVQQIARVTIVARAAASSLILTLRALASVPVEIKEAIITSLPHRASVEDKWTERTAGGSHAWPSYGRNPQYRLSLSGSSKTATGVLRIKVNTQDDVLINVKGFDSGGERVFEFEDGQIIAGDGRYEYGSYIADVDRLLAGDYSLVVSTYQPRQLSSFTMEAESSLPVQLTAIPQEGAGQFVRVVEDAWEEGCDGGKDDLIRNPVFELRTQTHARASVRIQATASANRPPVGIALLGSLASDSIMLMSQEFRDGIGGSLTKDIHLSPRAGPYYLIALTYNGGYHGAFHLRLYSDNPVDITRKRR